MKIIVLSAIFIVSFCFMEVNSANAAETILFVKVRHFRLGEEKQ